MANNPILMSKLRHVLKLHCQGQNKLQISVTTGLSRNTVKKYIRAFTGLKTTWEDINQLSDKELDEQLCVEPELVVPSESKPGVAQCLSFPQRFQRLLQLAAGAGAASLFAIF